MTVTAWDMRIAKIAAHHIGCSPKEWLARQAKGERWCWLHRGWLPLSDFPTRLGSPCYACGRKRASPSKQRRQKPCKGGCGAVVPCRGLTSNFCPGCAKEHVCRDCGRESASVKDSLCNYCREADPLTLRRVRALAERARAGLPLFGAGERERRSPRKTGRARVLHLHGEDHERG